MTTFLYRAKKGPSEVREASIEADSESAAVKQLTKSGWYPISIDERKEDRKGISIFSKRVKTRDLANFTRQLSELLDSGLALYEALNIIENQIALPQLKKVIRAIKNRIKEGNTFSESLKVYPNIFSNLYINLVKSGEAGSMLNEVLANIADFLEKQEDTRSKIIVALTYPMLMTVVGFLTIFVLMGFVIPGLTGMFIDMGEALPFPTRMLIGLSDFIRSYWILLVILLVAFIFFIKKTKSDKSTKRTIDRLKLKLPIFGALIKDTELARLSRTLSTLLRNGVPILHSLKITSDVIDNEVIKEEIAQIYSDVRAGSTLQAAIKKSPTFPPFVVNMAAIGEQGGFLDKTLLRVAENYERESDRTAKILSTLLEPAIILVMGLVVGFIVVSMLLPVFQISLTAH